MNEKQAEGYFEEAELSLESGKAVFERADSTGEELWHSVVKSSYDAMEQAISAALAMRGIEIPKFHPGKVEKFVNEFGESEITEKIYNWLGERSKSQYVDRSGQEILVPHKLFDREDAEEALEDAKFVIGEIKDLIDF